MRPAAPGHFAHHRSGQGGGSRPGRCRRGVRRWEEISAGNGGFGALETHGTTGDEVVIPGKECGFHHGFTENVAHILVMR